MQQPTVEELSMPPKDTILQQYGVLLADMVQMNAAVIDIGRLTKAGTHRLVMARGRQVLVDSMKQMGVLTMECILIQQLPPLECILNDGVPKYTVINGNHRVMTARKLFPNKTFVWCCNIVNVCIPDHFLCFFHHFLLIPDIYTAGCFGRWHCHSGVGPQLHAWWRRGAQGWVGGVLPTLLQASMRELLEVQGQGSGLEEIYWRTGTVPPCIF